MSAKLIKSLTEHLINLISETNGITLIDTLELAINSEFCKEEVQVRKSFNEFKRLLSGYQHDEVDIQTLILHPVANALKMFFKKYASYTKKVPLFYIRIYFRYFGKSKICNFDLISINKNIFWLEITVHYFILV